MNYCCSFDHVLSYEEFCEWTQYIHELKTNYVHFYYPENEDLRIYMKSTYQKYAERQNLLCEFNECVLTVRRPHRVTLDLYYKDKFDAFTGRNRMGCYEGWYDCYYAITQTVSKERINEMSDDALEVLIDCVCAVQEALY